VATQLVFTVQPSASTAGQAIAPPVQVAVHDAFGTLVTSADNAITLELQNNPSGAALTGTTTVGADSGAATFSDLQISKPGAGYTLRASASTLTGATSAAFDVSPVPGLATAMAPVAGDDQTATVGERVATSPSVRVTDGLGDPVANVGVTFSIGSGEGSASGAAQTTDAAGVATVGGWTLGTVAETNTLLAAVPGLDGSPVTFTATAVAAAAVALAMYDGDDQSAGVGTPVDPPSVLVTDTYGNGVANVTVTFAVTSGGGSITDPIQTTGTDGVAAVGSWTLGGALGDNTLSATSAGLSGSPVTFTATAISPPAGITVEVRNNYFLSLQNGSGNGTGFLENYATDTIPVGARVTWVWVGQNHNVSVAFSGLNLSGTHSAPFSYSRTYTTPGTYFYRCTNHSQVFSYPIIQGMVGIIVVQ
jgi:plastocyanin